MTGPPPIQHGHIKGRLVHIRWSLSQLPDSLSSPLLPRCPARPSRRSQPFSPSASFSSSDNLLRRPPSIVVLSAWVAVVRSGHGWETRRHGTQRLCNVVSNLSRSGDRRTLTSRREYSTTTAYHKRRLFLFPRLHMDHSLHLRTTCVKIWTDVDVFKGIPRTESIIPYVRVCRLSSMRAVMLIFDHSFSGDFFTPAFQCPHRVERVGTLGDGGKWTCGLDRVAKQKQCVIYSFGLSLPFSMPQWLTAC